MTGTLPQRLMVIAAHPDDPEFGCAGTVAKWVRQGASAVYVLLTSGDKGCHDPAVRPGEIAGRREAEQRAAAAAIGVQEVVFLRHPDGLLANTLALRRELAGIIRRYRPEVVFTIDPWRRYQLHPDHRAAGMAALDAIISAREWYLFPEQLLDGQQPWRVKEVYLFWTDQPDHWEALSEEDVEARLAALAHHRSQVGARWHELPDRLREGLRRAGREKNLPYAETFKKLSLG